LGAACHFIVPETVRAADSPTSRQSFDHDEVFYVQLDLAGTLGGDPAGTA
jgi:hypothetical protein